MSAYATQCPGFGKVNLALAVKGRRLEGCALVVANCFSGRLSQLNCSMFELEGLDHIALAVDDVERSAKWYMEVLGFERRFEGMWEGIPVFIGKGRTALALFPRGRDAASPTRGESGGMLHFALRADRKNFLATQQDLTSRGIAFHFQDHEISQSIYFRDPDGFEVEITTYELE